MDRFPNFLSRAFDTLVYKETQLTGKVCLPLCLRSGEGGSAVRLPQRGVQAADALSQWCSSCGASRPTPGGLAFAPGWIISALKMLAPA